MIRIWTNGERPTTNDPTTDFRSEMTTKVEERTFEDAVQWLRDHGFDLIEAPGTQGRVFLKKYNVSAAIQKDGDEGVKIFAYPGYLISGEISKLINRGYQQV